MISRLICLCGMLLAFGLNAQGLKLPSLTIAGTTYTNVTVLGVNTTDIYFNYDGGIANVKLKYLPADLQKQFHYDPRTAAKAEAKQLDEDARYQSFIASTAAANAEAKAASAQALPQTSEQSLADPVSDQSPIGKAAPPLKIDRWLQDKPDLDGKFVLVAFWAPWSIPCRKAIPEWNALQKKFADKLVVIGVSSGPESDVTDITDPKIAFPLAIDTKGKLIEAAGVTSLPCVLLIDSKGMVRYQGHPGAITEKKLQEIFSESE
ncbi:MAG TPA: TlpA disulfide reductase family protein [Verrucomicrobiae bacterium]|nr:TlpA disulfide reductase family protein [Verrucomicrobiae bacterium]